MTPGFVHCPHCGAVALLLRSGAPLKCCGEVMEPLEQGTGAEEKHAPQVHRAGNLVTVRVGQVPHPMTEEHYIEWVALETRLGLQLAHLTPEAEPKAEFPIAEGDEVKAAYAFCNQHKLWRNG